MSATQAQHHAPDEPVARALALVEQGHSYNEVAELVNHSERTVRRWVARSRELSGNKPILDKWTRRVDQSLDLLGDALDLIEADETGSLALKNMPNLNMVAGTGTDKLQKEKEVSQPKDLTQIVFVLNAQQPIEASPEPDPGHGHPQLRETRGCLREGPGIHRG